MTCIVGYVEGDKVFVGGDLAATGGYTQYIYHPEESKVFKKGDIVFGVTGASRIGQLIRHNLIIPKRKPQCKDIKYLNKYLIPVMLKCFKHNQMFKIKDERIEENWGAVIGYNKTIYRVDSNFNLMRTNKNYVAHGAGQEYAMGALYVMENLKMKPKEKITKALEASAEFSIVVAPPFDIVEL